MKTLLLSFSARLSYFCKKKNESVESWQKWAITGLRSGRPLVLRLALRRKKKAATSHRY